MNHKLDLAKETTLDIRYGHDDGTIYLVHPGPLCAITMHTDGTTKLIPDVGYHKRGCGLVPNYELNSADVLRALEAIGSIKDKRAKPFMDELIKNYL